MKVKYWNNSSKAEVGVDWPMMTQLMLIQEGQVAQNRSPEFSLKRTYKYLLKAGHIPGDTWGGVNFDPGGIM